MRGKEKVILRRGNVINLRKEEFVKQPHFNLKWIDPRRRFCNPVKNSLCKIKIEPHITRIQSQNPECINNFNRKFSIEKNLWLCLLWRIKLGPDLNSSFLIITEDNFTALYRESISVFIKKIINLLLSYMQVEWKYKLKLEIPEQDRFTRSKSTVIFSIFHPKISLLNVHNIKKGNLKEGGKKWKITRSLRDPNKHQHQL